MLRFTSLLLTLSSASILFFGAGSAIGKSASAKSSSERPLNATERQERKRANRAIASYRKQKRSARPRAAGQLPATPTALHVTAVTTTSASLDWTAPPGGAAAVRFITYSDGVNVASTIFSHSTIAGLKCGQAYKFTVVAVSAAGRRSKATDPLTATTANCTTSATPPAAPTTTTPDPVAPAPVAPDPVAPTPTPTASTFAQVLASDMSAASESIPHGITYDFAYKPRLSAGINPGGYTAFTGWGQLYECASGNPQPAARVEIRDIQSWIKSRATGAWKLVQQSTGTDGGAYSESFVDNASKPADATNLPSGSTSVTAGGGYNYHFWPKTARLSINPDDIAGVITNARFRFAPGTVDPAKPSPCYTLSMGADYWSALTAAWNQFLTNRDVGIGRFKRVDAEWRTGTMSASPGTELPVPAGSTAVEYR